MKTKTTLMFQMSKEKTSQSKHIANDCTKTIDFSFKKININQMLCKP